MNWFDLSPADEETSGKQTTNSHNTYRRAMLEFVEHHVTTRIARFQPCGRWKPIARECLVRIAQPKWLLPLGYEFGKRV